MSGARLTAYGPSPVKRVRRTNEQMGALDDAIVAAVEVEAPATLRGIFYRCVSAGAVDKTELGYKAVGRRLVALRRSGRVSYAHVTDGTRWITQPRCFDSVEEALTSTARLYRRRLWTDSEGNLQLYTEKDAISGVILPVTDRWDVPLGVLRGYVSESFAWSVSQSLHPTKCNVIAQLGDHDPSGLGAWHDFTRKVRGFAPHAWLTFERLAVTPEQIDTLRLPTRPTKRSDSRAKNFEGESVEVDAIAPGELRNIVEEWIVRHVDVDALLITKEAERSERDVLTMIAARPR